MELINANDLPLAGAMQTENGVIVLQNGKLVKMTLYDLLEYIASASVETDKTLTLDGVAADSLATGNAIKAARAFNLIDNGDFANPVNQRGKTSYNGIIYTIDRWRIGNTYSYVTVIDGGVNFSAKGGVAYPRQIIGAVGVPGKTYTAAACTVDGTVAVTSGVYPGAETGNATFGSAVSIADGVTMSLLNASGSMEFRLAINDGNDVTLKWAAVYDGEYTAATLPKYQPKGYAAELAECQRYYIPLNQTKNQPIGYGYTVDASNARLLIPIPTTMRVLPTIDASVEFHFRGGNTSGTFTDYSVNVYTGNAIRLNLTGNNLPVNEAICVYANFGFGLSADL